MTRWVAIGLIHGTINAAYQTQQRVFLYKPLLIGILEVKKKVYVLDPGAATH